MKHTSEFSGTKKIGVSYLDPVEQIFKRFVISKLPLTIETYHLTLSTFFWSFIVIIGGFLAKYDFIWLNLISIGIFGQYLTDLVDGEVGRKRNTGLLRWGFYMDHFLDYIFLVSLLFGYSFIIPNQDKSILLFTLGIIGGYMVNTFLLFGATGKFTIFYRKIGPSEIRMVFILLNSILFFFGKPVYAFLLPYFFILCFAGLIVTSYRAQKVLWESELPAQRSIFDVTHSLLISAIIAICLILTASVFLYHAHKTNPFITDSIFKSPIQTQKIGSIIVSFEKYPIQTNNSVFAHIFAYFKAAIHIVFDREEGEKKVSSPQQAYQDAQINRFNTSNNPYLITGGHFSILYPRNLGIFYYSLLDPTIEQSEKEWIEKEQQYLQTLHFATLVLGKCGNVYTTIVPIDEQKVTCVNMFSYPSDSLYGLVYAFDVLINGMQVRTASEGNKKTLHTSAAAADLLADYKDTIKSLYEKYEKKVYDKNTGLIKERIVLSSAKDAVKRKNAFYDNVIFWKTKVLLDKLDIVHTSKEELDNLKSRIITTFWDENRGFFREEISSSSGYSSDWLIVYSTSFLDIENSIERSYYEKVIEYIENNNIAKPFPIKYQNDEQQNTHLFVRLFAPNYQTNTLWSFWGLEYIKVLYDMYYYEKSESVKSLADTYYQIYEKNIKRDAGLDELYDSYSGMPYDRLFYRSVGQTGWIINMQQIDARREKFTIMGNTRKLN